MKYFENYPFVEYPVKTFTIYDVDENYVPYTTLYKKVIDLHLRLNISSLLKNNVFAYYEYEWQDSDNLTKLALNYYGSVDYTWLILLSGELFDWIHDLPLNDSELEKYIFDKYNLTFEQSLSTIHHYEDADKDIIDLNTYNIIPEPKYIKYVYDYEFEENEKKRRVKLVSRSYLKTINNNFENIIRKYKENIK